MTFSKARLWHFVGRQHLARYSLLNSRDSECDSTDDFSTLFGSNVLVHGSRGWPGTSYVSAQGMQFKASYFKLVNFSKPATDVSVLQVTLVITIHADDCWTILNQFSFTATSTPLPVWQVSILHRPPRPDAHQKSRSGKSPRCNNDKNRWHPWSSNKNTSRSGELWWLFGWSVGHAFFVGGWLAGWLVWITVSWFDFYIVSGWWDRVGSVCSLIKCGW